nr:DNA-directed DNA polymerase [Tanacetum cinerariifolium]
RVKHKQLNLEVGTERMIFNIDAAMKHSYSNGDTCFSIDVINEILEEDFDALLDEGSKILHSIEGTLLEEEIFSEFDEFMGMTTNENSKSESDTEEPPFEKITNNTDYKIKTSLEEPPTDLELKPFLIIWNMYSWKNHLFFLPMPFGLCNASATFQRCMLSIFHDMIEEFVEVFMDDFSVFGYSFDKCLNNLDKMLQRCKDFSKIALPLTKLLKKDTPFEFDYECQKAFELLKEKLTCAHVIVSPNWNLPFKLTCDASDFTIEVVLGQKDADHLSRIENEEISDDSKVDDNFPGETLMEINTRNEPCGQVKNTNIALKRILEKNVKDNPAIWSRKLDDALWAFRTACKTPTGTTPYKLIYGKNCHLPFEIKHRAYWALKNCNPDLIAAGEK